MLTPSGWTNIEDLKLGDNVVSGTGNITKVIGVYPQGEKYIYRMFFNDGTFVDSGDEHLWQVKCRLGRDNNVKSYPYKYKGVIYTSNWEIKTTKDIYDFYQTLDKKNRHINYELPEQPIVKFEEHPIFYDAYKLGLLLGDGCFRVDYQVRFSTADIELIKNFSNTKKLKNKFDYMLPKEHYHSIKSLGLFGKDSGSKFIPKDYLFNSVDVRLSILQGLMDTDGCVSGAGVEFTSVSKDLSEGVQFLVRSLGGYANITKRITKYVYKGIKKEGKPSYRVYIRLDKICPFKLSRKIKQWQELNSRNGKRTCSRIIESVEFLPEKDKATCISVDDVSHLYITKDFIITHNTHCSARIALMFLDSYYPSKVITTAPTNLQVEKLLWGEINSAFTRARPAFPGRCLMKEVEITRGEHFAIGFSTDEAVNWQGFHSPNLLTIVDEAAGVSVEIFEALDTCATGSGSRHLFIGNPDDAMGRFFDSFKDVLFNKITITAFDTPNFIAFGITLDDIRTGDWEYKVQGKTYPYPELLAPEWVADKYRRWGEESPLFIAKIMAEFPENSTDLLIPLSYLEAAQRRELKADGQVQYGLDIARFGPDKSILRKRIGNVAVSKWSWEKLSNLDLADWVDGIVKDRSELIVIDSVGNPGVIDSLGRKGYRNLYEYTGKPTPKDKNCFNERSRFYYDLKERFFNGEIAGIDEDEKEQLAVMKYEYKNGKIIIEDKAAIKKRLRRSPDDADSLCLAFAKIKPIFSKFSLRGVADLSRVSPHNI